MSLGYGTDHRHGHSPHVAVGRREKLPARTKKIAGDSRKGRSQPDKAAVSPVYIRPGIEVRAMRRPRRST